MIRKFALLAVFALSACRYGVPSSTFAEYQPRPGQGQYVRPAYLNPQPTPFIPAIDACQSRLYAGLVGQHEGAIFIAGLPGRKRVIKPARLEGFGYNPNDTFYSPPPLVEVREYLAGQLLYAPAISNLMDRLNLGPDIQERLTIELDAEGYVQQVDCR